MANTTNEYHSENSYTNSGTPAAVWSRQGSRQASEQLVNAGQCDFTQLSLFADGNDVTKYAGNITLSDTSDSVYSTLTFTVGKTDNAYLKDLIYTPKIGSIVQFGKGEEIFRGVIIDMDDGDLYSTNYTAADFGFYLKTEETYQFDTVRADMAVTIMLEDLGIPIYQICDISTPITEVYFDKAVSDIIKDIFKICGGGFMFDFIPSGIRIYSEGEFEIYPTYTPASNVAKVSAFITAHDRSHSESIGSMYNAVKAVSSIDNTYTELKTVFDNDSIAKYGFLQKIVSVDTEKENADAVCESNLTALNKVEESFGISIFCDISTRVRSGNSITYNDRKYIVKSASNTVCDSGEHFKTSLDLKGV